MTLIHKKGPPEKEAFKKLFWLVGVGKKLAAAGIKALLPSVFCMIYK